MRLFSHGGWRILLLNMLRMDRNHPPTHEEIVALHEKFRELKHSINNSLAVVMALSELGQSNPAQYEKLGKTVLTRGPDMVRLLQGFSDELAGWAKATAEAEA